MIVFLVLSSFRQAKPYAFLVSQNVDVETTNSNGPVVVTANNRNV